MVKPMSSDSASNIDQKDLKRGINHASSKTASLMYNECQKKTSTMTRTIRVVVSRSRTSNWIKY